MVVRFESLYVRDVERHVQRAIIHLSEGREEYAKGSLRKARKFALRKCEADIGFGRFDRKIDMARFDEEWTGWLKANGIELA